MKSPDHHIHHGTSTNPNPHEEDMTPEQIAERQERIDALVDHLLSGDCNPSDLLLDDCYDLLDMIVAILSCDENDNEGHEFTWQRMAIKERIDDACTRSAAWLIDQGNTTVSLAIKKKLGVE